jgi:apolipoprotein N-acyltransferase
MKMAIKSAERSRGWIAVLVVGFSMLLWWIGSVYDERVLVAALIPIILILAAMLSEIINLRIMLLKMELREYLRDDWPSYGRYA